MRFEWLGFDATPKLSAEEATELAARVADLTKAGLPLGAGLRAMADELGGCRLPRVLRGLADRMDTGDDLVGALESWGRSLPVCLRGLILAGVRSGRLAEVLEEYVDLQRSRMELRRRVWLSVAYPFVLLLFMTALAVAANVYIVGEFEKMYADFAAFLPLMTIWALNLSGAVMWLFLGLVGISVAIPLLLWLAPWASCLWPMLYRIPMLGPLLRWSHMAQFARLMGLLLEQKASAPDALRLSAAGLRDANLARGCRLVADDVEQGRALGQSMAARPPFPASLIPMVEWGQQQSALADAFRGAAEMFEGRVRSRGTLLAALLLPIMLLVIGLFVGGFVIALFLPLVSLIECLS